MAVNNVTPGRQRRYGGPPQQRTWWNPTTWFSGGSSVDPTPVVTTPTYNANDYRNYDTLDPFVITPQPEAPKPTFDHDRFIRDHVIQRQIDQITQNQAYLDVVKARIEAEAKSEEEAQKILEEEKKKEEERQARIAAGEEARDTEEAVSEQEYVYSEEDLQKLIDANSNMSQAEDNGTSYEWRGAGAEGGFDIGSAENLYVTEADIDGDGVPDLRQTVIITQGDSTYNDDGSIDLGNNYQETVESLTDAGSQWMEQNSSAEQTIKSEDRSIADFFADPLPGVEPENIDLKLNETPEVTKDQRDAIRGKAPIPGMVSIDSIDDAEFESVLGFNFDFFPKKYDTKSYDGKGNIVEGKTTDEFEAKTLKGFVGDVIEADGGEEIASNPLVDRIRNGESIKEVLGIDLIPQAKEKVEAKEEQKKTAGSKQDEKSPKPTFEFVPQSDFFKNEDNVTALKEMSPKQLMDLSPQTAEGTDWGEYDENATFEIVDPNNVKHLVTKGEWEEFMTAMLAEDFDVNKTLADMGLTGSSDNLPEGSAGDRELDKLWEQLEELNALRGAKKEELEAARAEWEKSKGDEQKEKSTLKGALKQALGFAKDMVKGNYEKYLDKVLKSFEKGTRASTAVSEADVKALHKELSLLDAAFRNKYKTANEYMQGLEASGNPTKLLKEDLKKYRERESNRMMYEKRTEAFIAQKLYMQAHERTDGKLLNPDMIMWNTGAFDPEVTALAMKLNVAQAADTPVWLLTDSDFAKLPDTVNKDEYISNSDFQLLLANDIDPSRAVYIPPLSVTLKQEAFDGQELIDASYAGTELDRDGDGIVDTTEVTFNTALTDPRGIDEISNARMDGQPDGIKDADGNDIPIAWSTIKETNGEPEYIDQDGAKIKNPNYKETTYDVPLYDRDGDGKIDETGEAYDKRFRPNWFKRVTGGDQEFGGGVPVREFNPDDTQGWSEARGADAVSWNPFEPTGGEYGEEAWMRNVVNPMRGEGTSGLGSPQPARKFDQYARTGLDYAGDLIEYPFEVASKPFTWIGQGLEKVPGLNKFQVMGGTLPGLFTSIGNSVATVGQELDEAIDQDLPNFFFDDIPQFARGGYQYLAGSLTGNQEQKEDGLFNIKDSATDSLKMVAMPFESGMNIVKPLGPYVSSALGPLLGGGGGGGGGGSEDPSGKPSNPYTTGNKNQQAFAQATPQRQFGQGLNQGGGLGNVGINAGSGLGNTFDGGLDLSSPSGQKRYADIYGMDALNQALAERGLENMLGEETQLAKGKAFDPRELARGADYSIKNRDKLNMPKPIEETVAQVVNQSLNKREEEESDRMTSVYNMETV